jgi:Ala-tRNA(Pro) deacylase
MNQQLNEFLGARGATYEVLPHGEATTSAEEAEVAHVSGWLWAKVVVIKHPHGFVLAVLPACCTIDLGLLKGAIGEGEIRLAGAEEILRLAPHFELGALPPFGRLIGVPTFVEEAFVNQREIVIPGGDHRTALRMGTSEYMRLAEPRTARFAVHGTEFPISPRPGAR